MTEHLSNVAALLDLAASTDDESIRTCALDRLAAAVGGEPSRAADGVRGTTARVDRFLDRLDRSGIPAPPRELETRAVKLGRQLIGLDSPGLDRLSRELGLVEALVIVRSIGRPEAAALLRSFEDEGVRLEKYVEVVPELSTGGAGESLRRFYSFSQRGFSGAALATALGRSLVASLLVRAEPDVVAAINRRLPFGGSSFPAADAAWFDVAARLVESPCVSPRT